MNDVTTLCHVLADLVSRNGTFTRSPLRFLRLRRLIHSFTHSASPILVAHWQHCNTPIYTIVEIKVWYSHIYQIRSFLTGFGNEPLGVNSALYRESLTNLTLTARMHNRLHSYAFNCDNFSKIFWKREGTACKNRWGTRYKVLSCSERLIDAIRGDFAGVCLISRVNAWDAGWVDCVNWWGYANLDSVPTGDV